MVPPGHFHLAKIAHFEHALEKYRFLSYCFIVYSLQSYNQNLNLNNAKSSSFGSELQFCFCMVHTINQGISFLRKTRFAFDLRFSLMKIVSSIHYETIAEKSVLFQRVLKMGNFGQMEIGGTICKIL